MAFWFMEAPACFGAKCQDDNKTWTWNLPLIYVKSFQWRHLLGGVTPNSFVFAALELSDSDNEQLSVLKMILIVFFFEKRQGSLALKY